MKNNNIDLFYLELLKATCSESPSDYFSSGADTGYRGNLGQSQGSNNPGITDPSSSSGQSGNSGSNNPDNIDPVRDFDTSRRAVGQKLRDLYVNRPARSRIMMTHPDYSDRINAWDHNVVCRSILDAGSSLDRNITLVGDSSRYKGFLTLELLGILER